MITQTDVYKRLKAEIDKTPAIDTHVHLGEYESPLTEDLNKVLQYHNYLSEVTGGRPGSSIFGDLPPRERVRALVPQLKKSNRSAHAWMLREVLRQVYDFDEPLTLDNCDVLFDKSVELSRRPNRLKEVCDIAGVSRILIHTEAKPIAECGYDDSIFVGLSKLSVPALPNKDALTKFEQQTGVSVKSAKDMVDAAVTHLKRCASIGQVGARADVSPGCVYRPGSDAEREAAFQKAAAGRDGSLEERQILTTLSLDATATAAAEAGLALQIFFARGAIAGRAMPFAEHYLLESLTNYVTEHPNTNFDVYTVVESFAQPLCLLAKYRSNLHLGGCWWFCQFPEIMSRTYSLRVDMIPSSKWSAFFSDAYVAEWIVGKMALTRKELARALTCKVTDDYITESDAAAIAKDVLFETPRRLYNLNV